jgi:16S rRNA (guanine(966)-N(2))-methyltransferase RsmD
MPNSELRIIAGEFKNQKYLSPGTAATHPMSEKLRSALFNILGDIEGLNVLDAYSGSGGIGLEAISRGAAAVTLIDSDIAAQKVAANNIRKFKLEQKIQLLRMSVETWLKTDLEKHFNVIIADPPYDNVNELSLIRLAELVTANGIFVLSIPAATQPPKLLKTEKLIDKIYGNSQLVFYRKIKT